MALATLVANQRKLKRCLGLVLQVLCLISDCRTQIEPYAGATQAEQSVPDAFAQTVSVFRLVCNRSHLLQVSLLGLPNDRLNFVLNISR